MDKLHANYRGRVIATTNEQEDIRKRNISTMNLTKKSYEIIVRILIRELITLDKTGEKRSKERKSLIEAIEELDTAGIL